MSGAIKLTPQRLARVRRGLDDADRRAISDLAHFATTRMAAPEQDVAVSDWNGCDTRLSASILRVIALLDRERAR